jgi:hypothetical protein
LFLRPSVLAALGFTVAAFAAVLGLSLDRDEPGDLPPPAVVGALPSPPPFSDRRLPAIDVLRIGDGGDVMVAGRSLPGASVRLHDAGRDADLGTVVADLRGEWVLVPELPLGAGVRLLVPESADAGGIAAVGDPVVVVIPADGHGAVAVETPAQGGPRLLQGPAGDDGRAPGGAGLDIAVVDRDADGRLTIAGRALPGSTVHLYVDNRFVGRARAGEAEAGVQAGEGGWRLAARAPQHGRHALRADAVNAKGKVLVRVEREWDAGDDMVPVQTAVEAKPDGGAWRIVRRTADGGTVYTVVYRGGGDAVRDPDVLYPGQVVSASHP